MTRKSDLIDRGEWPTVDFIVVGAGPAGCAVAARLAQSSPDTSVALIEAGPAKASLLSDVPVGVAALVPYRSCRNYAYETVPQSGFGGRKGYQPRGRGLGGSSLINAMIYTRGQPQDYDSWAALGSRLRCWLALSTDCLQALSWLACAWILARLADEIGGQRNRRRHRQCRNEPERHQRCSEHLVRRSGDQRDQRRLVDVAERGMQAADDEIELVAKDVVMGVGDEVNEQTRGAEPECRRARDPAELCWPTQVGGRCDCQTPPPPS